MIARRAVCSRAALCLLPAALLAACAQPEPPHPQPAQPQAHWNGRMQVRVEDPNAPRSLAALFDLQGSRDKGTLELSTPIGTLLARLQWQPGSASLQTTKAQRSSASLDDLLQETLGEPLPIDALFDWLAGQATAVRGWEVDLQSLAEGRMSARRTAPQPAVVLRIVLTR